MPVPFLDSTLRVRGSPRSCHAEALWLLWRRESPELRRNWVASVLRAPPSAEVGLQSLLEARRRTRLVGAGWGQEMPGRTASVWSPQLVAGESRHTADRLLTRIHEQLRRRRIALAQSLVRSATDDDAALLVSHGYRYAADLLYLVLDVATLDHGVPDAELTFEPCQDADRDRLAGIIAETYVATLDIPMMNGLRSLDDVLAGYAHTRAGDANYWFVVTRGDVDVGCLLLGDHPAADQLELVYMGIVPAARGRGWGEKVVRFTRRTAWDLGRSRVVLAVDAANEPAVAAYGRVGFHQWDRRGVFLKAVP